MLERLLDALVPGLACLYTRLCHGCERLGPNFVPARGAALVISNHPCHADAAFLMAGSRRWIHFLHAREEYDVRGLRPFFHLLGCIPVRRDRSDPSAIRLALEHLRRGFVVGIFPEGDLTPPTGLRPGHAGAALLALRSGVPVIPAFITGTRPSTGTVTDWLRPARAVRVAFGPPIDLAAYQGQPLTHARLQAATDLLMQRIAALQPSALGVASTSSPG